MKQTLQKKIGEVDSFYDVLIIVLNYFKLIAAGQLVSFSLLSGLSPHFMLVVFFDILSMVTMNWYFKTNYYNQNYLRTHWVRKVFMIPL